MSTFAKFWAVALLGSVSTASAYRSLSFEVDANSYTHNPTFSEWSSENSTFVYYSSCEMNFQRDSEPKECIVDRLQDDFSGTSPKEDRCNVKLHPQSGGWIDTFYVNIARMGEDRAILSWMEHIECHSQPADSSFAPTHVNPTTPLKIISSPQRRKGGKMIVESSIFCKLLVEKSTLRWCGRHAKSMGLTRAQIDIGHKFCLVYKYIVGIYQTQKLTNSILDLSQSFLDEEGKKICRHLKMLNAKNWFDKKFHLSTFLISK
ncbi:unnamed protein product [Trichogramma brassicae]|uniref:Uncharacterized protein n=1 Tax=Trichogramma brassicae TaxID=86971 RepID=A0A6H5IV96_9HYME|nr:unnamed protein product [Trichogramma brassicae]